MTAFDAFKGRPMQRLTSSLWNSLMDALNALDSGVRDELLKRVKYEDLGSLPYDVVPDQDNARSLGKEDVRWSSVYAYSGDFTDSLTVQGKPVIKDGDPITVSDLGSDAVAKIVQAVESARRAFALVRWGVEVEPAWVFGSVVTAPPANTRLVEVSVPSGVLGLVYGVLLSAGEQNSFTLSCGNTSLLLFLPGAETKHTISPAPICVAQPETVVYVSNNSDGTSGVQYQAGLLYAEVEAPVGGG
ncbi:MAG: hypothetical protein QXG54_05145 [Desulfurococcaceae archaeon]